MDGAVRVTLVLDSKEAMTAPSAEGVAAFARAVAPVAAVYSALPVAGAWLTLEDMKAQGVETKGHPKDEAGGFLLLVLSTRARRALDALLKAACGVVPLCPDATPYFCWGS